MHLHDFVIVKLDDKRSTVVVHLLEDNRVGIHGGVISPQAECLGIPLPRVSPNGSRGRPPDNGPWSW